ncbi:MAG: putative Ig domain-containing protein, partial [Thermoplasmata archaeon]|nr:putative Ig domain-containing protein [Thermoplasmata archaeon]
MSIKGLPANDDVGEYWINISVSDAEYIDYTNFTLTVVNMNDPPVITTEDKTNAAIDELYSVNYEAEDIDPTDDKLTWSLITDAGDWLTIDTSTGWLNGVPSKNDFGNYLVNISVTDGKSGWGHHNFTLQVSMENNAPELLNGSIIPSEGDMDTEFTFSVHYYDSDRQAPLFVQVIIDNTSYFMELQPGKNAFNGTYKFTTTLSKGTHIYYFTASDGVETVKTDNSTTQEIKKV